MKTFYLVIIETRTALFKHRILMSPQTVMQVYGMLTSRQDFVKMTIEPIIVSPEQIVQELFQAGSLAPAMLNI